MPFYRRGLHAHHQLLEHKMRRSRPGGPRTERVELMAKKVGSNQSSKSLGLQKGGAPKDDLDAELQRAMEDLAQLKEYYSDPYKLASASRAGSSGGDFGGSTNQNSPKTAAASLDRLAVAEAVIRKLYRRNQELEQETQDDHQIKSRLKASEKLAEQAQAEIKLAQARNAALEATLRATETRTAEQDAQIGALINRISDLQRNNEVLEETVRKTQKIKRDEKKKATYTKNLEAVAEESAQQISYMQSQIESLRAAQSLRINGSKKDTKSLVDMLSKQLDAQAEQHRRERAAFNEKLSRLEMENCELYVRLNES